MDPARRTVALKLLPGVAASAGLQRRFEVEVRALLRVRHPHVVALLDAGTWCEAPYLVLQWVEGETLAARLERQGPLAPGTAALLIERLAEAVAVCHAEGVLHRDIKPANVLLRRGDDAPLLADFGMAKELPPEVSLASTSARTEEGTSLGTPGF
jgi:serine/threonine-protein kinase